MWKLKEKEYTDQQEKDHCLISKKNIEI